MSRPDSHTPINIGRVIQYANVFDLKNWHKGTVFADTLPQSVAKLFALLQDRQIKYLLVGGVALLQYIEGRNTEDIDLIMALPSLKKLPEIEISDQNVYFARGKLDDLQIDILLTRNKLFRKVLDKYATSQQFAERVVPSATVEGLLLLKLYALPSLYREADFTRVGLYENDIATLYHDYRPALEPLMTELGNYLSPTDLTAVRGIVVDIQKRIERFDQGRQSPGDDPR